MSRNCVVPPIFSCTLILNDIGNGPLQCARVSAESFSGRERRILVEREDNLRMRVSGWCFLLTLLGTAAASPLQAQQLRAELLPSARPAKISTGLPAALRHTPQASPAQTTHRFWDRENDLLFAAVGAGR